MYDPERVYNIPLAEIFVDEDFNCRGAINPMDVIDLSKDIKDHGLHTPVFIQPWDKIPGKKFRLVAGYRRTKAVIIANQDPEYAAKAGDKAGTIPALVKEDLDEFSAGIMNLSENLQRKNLDMKQEAHAIQRYKDSGWSEIDTAKKLNMSRGWVQVRYMLLDLPDDIQNEAAAGMLSQAQVRHAFALRDNEEAMYGYVKAVKDKKILGKKREIKPDEIIKNEKKIRTETEMFALQDRIREVFGNNMATKVLGWAAGLLSDYEIHNELWQMAATSGKMYIMPTGLRPTVSKEPELARSAD